MVSPQPTDAHLRVAHSINEAIMLRDFSKRQRKILDLILRLSWGCGKKFAYIPEQKDFEVVGILATHVKQELYLLEESKIISRDGPYYWFNKHFDEWQISRVHTFAPAQLTDLVSLNLNGSKPEVTEMVSDYPKLHQFLTKVTETVSGDLPKQEVQTYQNSKSPTPNLASPKESIKERLLNKDSMLKKDNILEEDGGAKNSFEIYKEGLRKEFNDLDFDTELRKFNLYWTGGQRKLKNPKLALFNWMTKAREIKKGIPPSGRPKRGQLPGNEELGAQARAKGLE